MEKVFIADKSSYGSEFYDECKTLDELKKAIVYHELYCYFDEDSYTDDMYTEELFKKHSTDYTLYEVELHDEEYIQWHEYDGKSWFSIEKKDPKLLSIVKVIKGE